MLRKSILPAIVACLLLVTSQARAQFQAQDWELTLGGTGANGPDFDGTSFAVQGNLGYFFTNQFELSLRQTIGYSDLGGGSDGSALNGSTRVAADYHFDLGKWQPYVGANFGYVYGDAVNDTWEAAPEAGVKYFVNSTTFIVLSAEYQFFFDNADDDFGDSFSDGQFVYGLNIGFRWR